MSHPPFGELELEVWRYIADHAPVAARQVAAQFAEQRGLARTTVLTVIERLRQKGYLTRRRHEASSVTRHGYPPLRSCRGSCGNSSRRPSPVRSRPWSPT